jgi:hypothetical protein
MQATECAPRARRNGGTARAYHTFNTLAIVPSCYCMAGYRMLPWHYPFKPLQNPPACAALVTTGNRSTFQKHEWSRVCNPAHNPIFKGFAGYSCLSMLSYALACPTSPMSTPPRHANAKVVH